MARNNRFTVVTVTILMALAAAGGLRAQEAGPGKQAFRVPGERFLAENAARQPVTDHAGPDRAWLVAGAQRAAERVAGLPDGKTLWRASLAAVIAASAVDAQSSWGKNEANPLLANGAGRFGGRSVAIKGVITGGMLGAQWMMVRHRPEMRRWAMLGNFGLAAIYAKVAAHNYENGR